ncbi:MAG: hypothetical protein AAGF92_06995 [Myxococcota bacterium]
MRSSSARGLWLVVALAFLSQSCGNERAPVDRVGTNAVQKSFFENSSWYFSRTVIDVDYEGGLLGSFPGDAALDFQGSDLASIPRIRWVIEEETLFAFRDYELVEGANPGSPEPGSMLGQPVAAFEIEKHFDIRRAYNDATGEELNIIEENDTDRPWFEREFMRVNWADNILPGYYGQITELNEIVGNFERQSANLFIQEQSEFPDSWQTRFHFMECDGLDDESEACTDDERPWADDYPKEELYAFDFVTQEILAPGNVPDPFFGEVNFCLSNFVDSPICSSVATYVRNSFLRVSDDRQYVPVNWVDSRFERAGYFRLERPTVDRSDGADDPAFFSTDFLNYNINRHNIWYDWWDEDGDPVPHADRRVRPIIFYTTPELPAHLVGTSFEVASRWDEVFMQTVRRLQGRPDASYPDVACQDTDPDRYCACTRDPDDGTVLNPTCPGRYDPFESPAAAEARGVANPYDCYIDVPNGAQPNLQRADLEDDDFYGWFDARQVGSECVLQLRVNACNKATIAENGGTREGLECQERGDARFKFLSYVDQPGTGFLGIATLRGDPVTGEILIGDANIGGPALDSYRTTALQMYDLVNGDLTNEEFLTGEDVRLYLENLDRVQLPARPRTDFSVGLQHGSALAVDRQAVDNRMAAFAQRAQLLSGPNGRANTFVDRRADLVGTDIEYRVMQTMETLMLAGIDTIPDGYGPADIDDSVLDQVSPFRRPMHEQMRHFDDLESTASRNNVMMPNEFVDNSVLFFVNQHRDWSRARLEIGLNQLLYFHTQLHELGHCLGLRHDFGASTDTENYDDEYYQIAERFPLPDPDDYDIDGTPGLDANEQVAFERALDLARGKRELAGIDAHMDSSVMEYIAQWYGRTTTEAGRYDVAAVSYGYGDLVEVYDNAGSLPIEDVDPTTARRVWAKYYHGGEVCSTDANCPFATDGTRSDELLQVNRDAGLTQSCVPHPQGAATHGSICSNFDDDAAALAETNRRGPYLPVNYRFCSDERVGTLGWCHRFDEGDSYREIVRNVAEQYERQYIFTNFRRYQSDFSIGDYISNRLVGRQYSILQSIFRNLIYRYQADPAFRSDEGAFGFYDQFMASADVLNFYARVLGQPDIGSYLFDPVSGNFRRASATPGLPGSELDLSIGLGRYFSSTYQRGLTGIERIERIGSFYDKWIAIQMLTDRGGATDYTRDVPFWVNFNDLFPIEMQQIFQGMIQDQPESISPRVACDLPGPGGTCAEPRVIYMDFYRGDCSVAETCRPDPVAETYADLDVVDGGSSVLLQFLAATFALADFPTFFDTTFQNQLFICVEGEGDCFAPSDGSVEGVDFVRHRSTRFGKTFLAFQIEPAIAVPNQQSIGFNMVKEASDNSVAVDVLERIAAEEVVPQEDLDTLTGLGYRIPVDSDEAVSDLNALDGRQRDLESFFFQLIDLQRQLGIAGYLRF